MDRTLLDSETYWINSHMIWEYNQTVYHSLILAGLMLAHNQLLLVHVNARPRVLELRHQISRWHLRWEGRRCSFIESRCLFPSCFHFFGEEDPFSDNKHRYSYPESDTLHGNAYEFSSPPLVHYVRGRSAATFIKHYYAERRCPSHLYSRWWDNMVASMNCKPAPI